MIYCKIKVVHWLWEASVWSLCAWYKPKQMTTNIEKETNGCRRKYGQEQWPKSRWCAIHSVSRGGLLITVLTAGINIGIILLNFLATSSAGFRLLASLYCTLESLHYLHYVYPTLSVSMKSE